MLHHAHLNELDLRNTTFIWRRNVYRGTPRSFALDSAAIDKANVLIVSSFPGSSDYSLQAGAHTV